MFFERILKFLGLGRKQEVPPASTEDTVARLSDYVEGLIEERDSLMAVVAFLLLQRGTTDLFVSDEEWSRTMPREETYMGVDIAPREGGIVVRVFFEKVAEED
jgi:hypothetical protein